MNAAVEHAVQRYALPLTAGCKGVAKRRPGLLRLASAALLVAALVLGWFAFTRFDHGAVPQAGSPAYRDFHEQRLADARLSVVLGLGASFALFGAFACHSMASRPSETGSGSHP